MTTMAGPIESSKVRGLLRLDMKILKLQAKRDKIRKPYDDRIQALQAKRDEKLASTAGRLAELRAARTVRLSKLNGSQMSTYTRTLNGGKGTWPTN